MFNSFEEGIKTDEEFIFKEYSVDDSLTGIERLRKYKNSDFHLQRLNLVHSLYDTVLEIGIENCYTEDVSGLIQGFLNDNEQQVRRELAEQIYPISVFYLENGNYLKGYKTLTEIFIPFIFELVIDKKLDVSEAGTNALVKMATLILPQDIESELFTTIKRLGRCDNSRRGTGEEHRIAAAKLYNELAPIFGEKLCVERVVGEMEQLSKDLSLSVRKSVAQNLSKLCPIVGKNITIKKVLPFYMSLCSDDIWGVRKACCESICTISENVSQKERKNQLTKLFTRFCSDSSRWVKIEMFRQLGRFISTFQRDEIGEEEEEEEEEEDGELGDISKLKNDRKSKKKSVNVRKKLEEKAKRREEIERRRIEKLTGDTIPKTLIKYFNDMAYQSEQSDTDLVEFCAYNFPAVTQAVGKNGWYKLEKSFRYLSKDMQWKVRKTLAFSLVKIAEILLSDDRNDSEKRKKSQAENKNKIKIKNKKQNPSEEELFREDFNFDETSEILEGTELDEDLDEDISNARNEEIISKSIRLLRKKHEDIEKEIVSKRQKRVEKSSRNSMNKKHNSRKDRHSQSVKNDSQQQKRVKNLGEDVNPCEVSLVQAAHSFLRDIDDVKLGVVQSLTSFLKLISHRRRDEFIGLICQIVKDAENWRIKAKIAEQLPGFLLLFMKKKNTHNRCRRRITRIFKNLIHDDYAIIRDTCAAQTGKVLNCLIKADDEENYKEIMLLIVELVDSKKGNWISRMLYITICKFLVREISSDIFEKNFLSLLLNLSRLDNCVNVRILAAKVLSEDVLQAETFKNDHRVLKAIHYLKEEDEDEDVRFFASQTKVTYESALQSYDIKQVVLEKEKELGNEEF